MVPMPGMLVETAVVMAVETVAVVETAGIKTWNKNNSYFSTAVHFKTSTALLLNSYLNFIKSRKIVAPSVTNQKL
jgi:hypothetical protein